MNSTNATRKTSLRSALISACGWLAGVGYFYALYLIGAAYL